MNPMTDDLTAADRAERIRRLQERRAGTSARTAPRPSTTINAATEAPARPATSRSAGNRAKPRRRHPAAATRIMLAGLSVASFLGIAGSVALASGATTAAAPTPVAATPAAAVPASANATAAVGATPAQAASTATAAKAGAASAAAPHVKTRGS